MAGAVTVVKIGGSFAVDAALPGWLDALARCAGRVVVVTGGGRFADAVRAAQPALGFDDRAAHHMALLAMEQFGCALASLHARFRLATSADAIRRAMRAGEVPVWAPSRMALAAADIPASWDVTSDSLAAWLAGTLRAQRLLLLKHAGQVEQVEPREPGGEPVSAAALVAAGMVDAAFPGFLERSGVPAFLLGNADAARLEDAADGRAGDAIRVVLP